MKIYILILLSITQLFAQQVNFMDDTFTKIIRFDSIQFENNKPVDNNISGIISKIHNNLKEGSQVYVSVIGHNSVDIDSNKSILFANVIKDMLVKRNISETSIFVEGNGSKEPSHLGDNSLSNRVMVALYVKKACQELVTVVLLENDQAQNAITVSTDGGSVDVNTVNDYVGICSKKQAPKLHKAIPYVELEKDFSYEIAHPKPICDGEIIVLLMDQNKTNNAVRVVTNAGFQNINTANNFVKICSKNKLPSKPSQMSHDEINAMFPYIMDNNAGTKIVKNIYFTSETLLSSVSSQEIDEIVKTIKSLESPIIIVRGYTDTLASNAYNDELGHKRAKAIVDILQENGVKYIRLVTESYGENNLAIPTEDQVFEPFNRRVEIEIR